MKLIDLLFEEWGSNRDELILLIRGMSEQIAFYHRLLKRYEVDVLTGLPGNNQFQDYITKVKSNAKSIGIIFFDVNGLKHCNDTKGHQAGDLLIQKAAESIIHITGGKVKAFRTGGDEFVAVVTDCTKNELDGIITKWREKLQSLNTGEDGIQCSIAAGAAVGSGDYNISDILKLADERMYEDKRSVEKD